MKSSARRRLSMVRSCCTASQTCSGHAKDRVGWAGRLVGVILGGLILGGCVEKVTESTKYSENREFSERPTVISSTPRQDAAALNAAQDRLTEVRYGVLEKKGPKTAWEGCL